MAIKYLNESVAKQQFNLDFNLKLANAYFNNGDFSAAEKQYTFVLKENKNNITALTNLGFIKINSGEIDLAKKYYEDALAINPDYVPALLNLVGYHFLRQEKEAAKRILLRVLNSDKNNATAKMLLEKL